MLLHPLIALSLFFSGRSPSITGCPFGNDLNIQYLYNMAASNEQDQQNNILLLLLESQDRGYDRLLSIGNTVGPPDVLIQAINDAKFRNDGLKNKDGSHLTGSLSNNRATANSIAASSSTDVDHRYKQGMDFVEQFKQARI